MTPSHSYAKQRRRGVAPVIGSKTAPCNARTMALGGPDGFASNADNTNSLTSISVLKHISSVGAVRTSRQHKLRTDISELAFRVKPVHLALDHV